MNTTHHAHGLSMGDPSTGPVLEVKNLSTHFHTSKGVLKAVDGVSFSIGHSEILALVGESGCGKSVTALSIMRLIATPPGKVADGEVIFNGQNLLRLSPAQMQQVRGNGIGMIFQEPMTSLNPVLTIGEQISETLIAHRSESLTSATEKACELLDLVRMSAPRQRLGQYPHELSGGMRQRVMIAMALACEPKLLIADEPTTALDVSLRQQILDLLDSLQEKHGMAILLITHDLNMVRRFADKVVVLEGGYVVEQGEVSQVLAKPFHPYTKKLVNSQPTRNVLAANPMAPVVIQAKGIRVIYPVPRSGWRGWFGSAEFVALHGMDFELRAGQTLGIIGESGSGKSSLALAVLNLISFSGNLTVDGRAWSSNAATDLPMRQTVQVVFQDPFSSLSPRMTVEQVVGEGLQLHQPNTNPLDLQMQVLSALAEVGLDEGQFPGLLARYPHEFSGGQRQRIAIARALIVKPRVLVLDEPTSALDVTIQKQVLDLLQRLQRERGLSYVLISHDMDVVQAMAHQVLTLKDGHIVETQ